MEQTGGAASKLYYGMEGPEMTTSFFINNIHELKNNQPLIKKYTSGDREGNYYIDKRILFSIFDSEAPHFFDILLNTLSRQNTLLRNLLDSMKNEGLSEEEAEVAKSYIKYGYDRVNRLEDHLEDDFYSVPSGHVRTYSGVGIPDPAPGVSSVASIGSRKMKKSRKPRKSRKVNKKKNKKTRKGHGKHKK